MYSASRPTAPCCLPARCVHRVAHARASTVTPSLRSARPLQNLRPLLLVTAHLPPNGHCCCSQLRTRAPLLRQSAAQTGRKPKRTQNGKRRRCCTNTVNVTILIFGGQLLCAPLFSDHCFSYSRPLLLVPVRRYPAHKCTSPPTPRGPP